MCWLRRCFHRKDLGERHQKLAKYRGKESKRDSILPDSAVIGRKLRIFFFSDHNLFSSLVSMVIFPYPVVISTYLETSVSEP